jgi:hypothetical protein
MILELMGYYHPILVYTYPVALMSSLFLARSTTVAFPGDRYLPHAKAHRVMLCPDGPNSNTGFVALNYHTRMRMILTRKEGL